MKIQLYQIIVVSISAIMLFTGIKEFIKRETGQTFLKLFVRLVVWGGMALITIYPKIITFMAKLFGIIDNMNAVILTGFIMVFLLIFKLLSAIEKIEQNISELTRKDALKKVESYIEESKK